MDLNGRDLVYSYASRLTNMMSHLRLVKFISLGLCLIISLTNATENQAVAVNCAPPIIWTVVRWEGIHTILLALGYFFSLFDCLTLLFVLHKDVIIGDNFYTLRLTPSTTLYKHINTCLLLLNCLFIPGLRRDILHDQVIRGFWHLRWVDSLHLGDRFLEASSMQSYSCSLLIVDSGLGCCDLLLLVH